MRRGHANERESVPAMLTLVGRLSPGRRFALKSSMIVQQLPVRGLLKKQQLNQSMGRRELDASAPIEEVSRALDPPETTTGPSAWLQHTEAPQLNRTWEASSDRVVVCDGPMGTQLAARGVDTTGPAWSANANEHSPESVAAIHRAYVDAGATVHTANTFRTRRRNAGQHWRELTTRAVDLARSSVPADQWIAGSIGPLADCYEPEKTPSPSLARREHQEMADALAENGCDVLLCETFANLEEAAIATAEAVRTGLPTWVALTAGYRADLLSPEAMAEAAGRLVDLGAEAVLVNCTPALVTRAYVDQLARLRLPVRIGAYANAGDREAGLGWHEAGGDRHELELDRHELDLDRQEAEASGPRSENGAARLAASRYADCAVEWLSAGATIVGGCCGTGPEHIRQIRRRLIGG